MLCLLNLLLLISLVSIICNQAHFHCIDILDQYFSCRHLNPINLVKNPPFGPTDWYVFNGSLDDAFYARVLDDSSIESALDLFRRIAVENSQSCRTLACNCTRSNSIDIGKVYQFYFLNVTYFPQVKAIVSRVAKNYSLLTPVQIYSRTGQFYALFDATIYVEVPHLVQYCLANDFTFNRIYNYKETYDCYSQAYLKNNDNLFECDWAYLMFDSNSSLAIFNKTNATFSALEAYYSCRLAPVFNIGLSICPIDTQRFIALNYIESKIVQGDLNTYIDFLLNKSNSSRPSYRFNISRIYTNLGVSPLKNNSQICPIRSQQQTISCLRSSKVNIDCAGDEKGQASWANITFVLDANNSFSLFVNLSSMPRFLALDANNNKSSVIMMPDGSNQKWIESATDGLSTTYIVDHNSNSTFLFEDKFSITIYSPMKSLENATGLLVSGCSSRDAMSIG